MSNKYQWLREVMKLDDSCENSGDQKMNAEVRCLIADYDYAVEIIKNFVKDSSVDEDVLDKANKFILEIQNTSTEAE